MLLENVLGGKLSSYEPITMEQAIPKSKDQAQVFLAIVVGESFEALGLNWTGLGKAFYLCAHLNKVEGKKGN